MKQLSFPLAAGPGAWRTQSLPGLGLWAAVLIFPLVGAHAENTNEMVKPPVALPGGLSPYPVVTSVTKTQDLVTVQWFGIQGPFQVLHGTTANTNLWTPIGPSTFHSSLTTSVPGDEGFFRVLSGRPVSTDQKGGTMNYVGSAACMDCHADTHHSVSLSSHAKAFETLGNQQDNPLCLTCHTVGAGTPLGFKSHALTPHLEGVQCENCHGPAGNHVANIRDVSARPKVTVAAEVCGGCHNYHHETFNEWKASLHGVPNEDVADSTLQQGESRMMTCGVCHSGAVRESVLESVEHPGTPLPSRADAAYFPVTCAVCHDAHEGSPTGTLEERAALRNPLYSTENFSYVTSTNPASFASQYNSEIQICGQCHNMRGARWQDTSRPPHHSPQYNLLVGKGAYDLGKSTMSAHGDIETQCVWCHSATLPSPKEATITAGSHTGHTFQPDFDQCAICHITTRAALRAMTNTQTTVQGRISDLKGLLDQWATNKASTALQKYGALAWEYSTPGSLSNPTNNPALKGPSSAEQAQVPDAIKQARMNMYLVQYDGSFGVHNGDYSRYLLDVARTNVQTELAKP